MNGKTWASAGPAMDEGNSRDVTKTIQQKDALGRTAQTTESLPQLYWSFQSTWQFRISNTILCLLISYPRPAWESFPGQQLRLSRHPRKATRGDGWMKRDSYETPPFPEREKTCTVQRTEYWRFLNFSQRFSGTRLPSRILNLLDSTTCASALIKDIGND